MKGFKLEFLDALDQQEVEDLFGNQISEVSNGQFIVGVNPLSELIDQWILLSLAFSELCLLWLHGLTNKILIIVCVEVVELAVKQKVEVALKTFAIFFKDFFD